MVGELAYDAFMRLQIPNGPPLKRVKITGPSPQNLDTMLGHSMAREKEYVFERDGVLMDQVSEVLQIPSDLVLMPVRGDDLLTKLTWRNNDHFRYRPDEGYPRQFWIRDPTTLHKYGYKGEVGIETGVIDEQDKKGYWNEKTRYVCIDFTDWFTSFFGSKLGSLNRSNVIFIEDRLKLRGYYRAPLSTITISDGLFGVYLESCLEDEVQDKLREVFFTDGVAKMRAFKESLNQ